MRMTTKRLRLQLIQNTYVFPGYNIRYSVNNGNVIVMTVLVAFTSSKCGACAHLKVNVLPNIKAKYPVYDFEITEDTKLPSIFDFQVTFFPALIAIKEEEFARFYDPYLKLKASAPKRSILFTGINCAITTDETSNHKYLTHTGYPHDANNVNAALDSL